MKGIYVLIIQVSSDVAVQVGALGKLTFKRACTLTLALHRIIWKNACAAILEKRSASFGTLIIYLTMTRQKL